MSSLTEKSVAQGIAAEFVDQGQDAGSQAISVTMQYKDVKHLLEDRPAPKRPNRNKPRPSSLTMEDLKLISIAPPAEWLQEKSW